MRKVIAAINMTLDGFFDHTLINPDDEVHQHYTDLIANSGSLLYGRITYHLMEYWRTVVENPTDSQALNDFAAMMDSVPKIVFSRTLNELDWHSAALAKRELREEVLALKQQDGKDISIGSRSLMIALLKEGLVDEFQLMIHPVIAGGGLPLFDAIDSRTELKLVKTKKFGSGAVTLYYEKADG